MTNEDEHPTAETDPLAEIQAAIDRLVFLAWERWGEAATEIPDDVRDALVDLRPIVAEIDALWLHLRQTLGR